MSNHDQDRIESWLKKALDMEHKGRDFYLKAASLAKETLIREFFTNMAALEKVHIERILAIHASLKENVCWTSAQASPPNTAAMSEVFKRLGREETKKVPDAAITEAIDVAIKFETELQTFYEKEIKNATCDGERQFLKSLTGEESDHHRMLADMKLYFIDPAAFAEQMANISLDG